MCTYFGTNSSSNMQAETQDSGSYCYETLALLSLNPSMCWRSERPTGHHSGMSGTTARQKIEPGSYCGTALLRVTLPLWPGCGTVPRHHWKNAGGGDAHMTRQSASYLTYSTGYAEECSPRAGSPVHAGLTPLSVPPIHENEAER